MQKRIIVFKLLGSEASLCLANWCLQLQSQHQLQSTLERPGFSSSPKHRAQQKEKIGQENGTNVFNTLLVLFYDVTNFLENYLNF